LLSWSISAIRLEQVEQPWKAVARPDGGWQNWTNDYSHTEDRAEVQAVHGILHPEDVGFTTVCPVHEDMRQERYAGSQLARLGPGALWREGLMCAWPLVLTGLCLSGSAVSGVPSLFEKAATAYERMES
ncbi:hypothetical protein LCGC14_2626470, partial [marine sediment metagenome]